MCELLVWKAAYPLTGTAAIDRHRPKPGCVITSQTDGWGCTQTEQTDPRWRIVKLPGLSPSQGQAFAAPDPGYGDLATDNGTLRRWAFVFNATGAGLPANFLAYWADDTRAAASISLGLTTTAVAALKIAAPTLSSAVAPAA